MTHLTPNSQPLFRRRGISLLEVLISMFVLAIGIMGVAALIPAGRFEILQGAKADHAGMVGRAAFRELKVRGFLNPTALNPTTFLPFAWTDSGGTVTYQFDPTNLNPFNPPLFSPPGPPRSGIPDLAVAIDPLGLIATFVEFPKGAKGTLPLALNRVYPNDLFRANHALADPIFRNGDDLVFTASTIKNAPSVQQMMGAGAKRASQGDYSWLATLVSEPNRPIPPLTPSNGLTGKVVVSVAVFYKRDFSIVAGKAPGETIVPSVTFLGSGLGGGEVQLNFLPATIKAMKPGQWLMLAGQRPEPASSIPIKYYRYYRWYRVVAADVVNGTTQNVTLTGPDWDYAHMDITQAWIFDGLIAVYEKNMRLELP